MDWWLYVENDSLYLLQNIKRYQKINLKIRNPEVNFLLSKEVKDYY